MREERGSKRRENEGQCQRTRHGRHTTIIAHPPVSRANQPPPLGLVAQQYVSRMYWKRKITQITRIDTMNRM
jgi:hypothetical protein